MFEPFTNLTGVASGAAPACDGKCRISHGTACLWPYLWQASIERTLVSGPARRGRAGRPGRSDHSRGALVLRLGCCRESSDRGAAADPGASGRNGRPGSAAPVWTDTLEIKPGEIFEIAFWADYPGIWMDHCHNLNRVAVGMTMHLAYEGMMTPYFGGHASGNQPECHQKAI